jgi:hypothetical protein
MNMPVMNNWEDVLKYVHRLGFAGNGTIQYRQDNLMDVVHAIEYAAGIPRNARGTFGYPLKITFKRPKQPFHTFVWRGTFNIECSNGTVVELKVSSIRRKW